MELTAPTCILRPFRASDAESLARHANDLEVWRNLRDAFPHPYTLADAESYIALASARPVPTSLAIDVGGSAVGGIALRPGTDIERIAAELGYWLGRPYWGRGIVTDAVRLMTAHAFDTLGLVRVFAVPFAHNAASARVLEKAGYAREGIMRRSAVKEGVVLDQYLYAAVRE
jgi:RimJ/RimL family protein N-acetyltransferase